MANSTNPSSPIDMTAITAAITDGTAQEVAAIQQLQAASNTKIREVVEFEYKANPWTNDPTQHVAVTPDTATQAIVFTNIGTESVAWDLFFDTALKTSTPQFDNIMPPGGSVRVSAEESSAGILLYTLTGSASMVLVNVQK